MACSFPCWEMGTQLIENRLGALLHEQTGFHRITLEFKKGIGRSVRLCSCSLYASTQALDVMKRSLLLGVLSLLGVFAAKAEITVEHNAVPNPEIFGLSLGSGQEMYCRVRAVNSVSLQTYLTPAYSVVEMVIDVINSPLQVRIYSAEPLNGLDAGVKAITPVAEEVSIGLSALEFVEGEGSCDLADIESRRQCH